MRLIPQPTTTGRPPAQTPVSYHHHHGRQQDRLELATKYASETDISTRFTRIYNKGVATSTRGVAEGFEIHVNLENGLWGFCGTGARSAADCSMAGICFDDTSQCTDNGKGSGCGFTGREDFGTVSCDPDRFCSTDILTLTNDVGAFYAFACGPRQVSSHYKAFPAVLEAQTTTTPSSATSSVPTGTASTSTPVAVEPTTSLSTTSLPSTTSTTSGTTLSNNSDAATPANSQTNSSNVGAIVGGVIGGLALICLTALAVVWMMRRNRGGSGYKKTAEVSNVNNDRGMPPPAVEEQYTASGWSPRELDSTGQEYARAQELRVLEKPYELPTSIERFELPASYPSYDGQKN